MGGPSTVWTRSTHKLLAPRWVLVPGHKELPLNKSTDSRDDKTGDTTSNLVSNSSVTCDLRCQTAFGRRAAGGCGQEAPIFTFLPPIHLFSPTPCHSASPRGLHFPLPLSNSPGLSSKPFLILDVSFSLAQGRQSINSLFKLKTVFSY